MAVHSSASFQGEMARKVQCLSNLTVVLLGERLTGKSSAGNTLFGSRQFEAGTVTRQSVRRFGMVAGRRTTVVDTPGWYSQRPTPESVWQEIKRGTSLCHPEPHAFLLVLTIGKEFGQAEWRATKEHLDPLQSSIWPHVMVLFNRGDRLEGSTIEEYIEEGGQHLLWLIETCGKRYHVLDRDVQNQVHLLRKIESMVAGNSPSAGQHLKTDLAQATGDLWKVGEEWRRTEEREQLTQRPTALPMEFFHGSPMGLVLLGRRVAGKSSAGNTILGRREFKSDKKTAFCVQKQGTVAGRRLVVVDTPGWSLYGRSKQEHVRQEIVHSVSLCPPGPPAFTILLTIPVDSFKEKDRRAVEEHLGLLGEGVWRHTLVLFTWGDRLRGTTIRQHIEKTGTALRELIDKCGNRYHVFNNKTSSSSQAQTQVIELLEMIDRSAH